MNKVNYAILVITLLFNIAAQAQKRVLEYAAENFNIRNFYIAKDGYKILAEVQKGAKPMRIFLMNKENLFVDTLSRAIYFENVHPLADGRIIVEGPSFAEVWHVSNDQILVENKFFLCNNMHRYKLVNFHKWLFWVNQIWTKNNYLINIGFANPDGVNNGCIEEEKLLGLWQSTHTESINKKLIYSLPHTFGVGKINLGLFMRDAQIFFLLDRMGNYLLYKFPVNDDFVWSYFFDWATEKHYFVKASKDSFELYVKNGDELVYVQLLRKYPQKIVNNSFIYCDGHFKKNCDYYYEPIKPEKAGNPTQLTLLKTGKIK